MFHSRWSHGHEAHSGFASVHGHPDRARGHHVELAVLAFGVVVVVAGEDLLHSVLVEQIEVPGAGFDGDIEVLVRFVGRFRKNGMCWKTMMLPPAAACPLASLARTRLPFWRLHRDVVDVLFEIGIQHDACNFARAEGVIVGAETLAVTGQRSLVGSFPTSWLPGTL